MKPVSIIIVNWNGGTMLSECIKSVLLFSDELVEEIIIVDNASSDNSMNILPQDPLIKVVNNSTNRGFGAACNQGYYVSKGEFVLLLNPDARLLPGTLKSCCTYMRTHNYVGVLGARHIDDNNEVQPSCSRFPSFVDFISLSLGLHQLAPRLFRSPILMVDHNYEKEGKVDQVMGAFMFIRRSVISKLDTFMDERFFVYFDDLDFSKRVSLKGDVSYYNPAITIYHKGNGTTENIRDVRLCYSLQSRLKYIDKYFGSFQTFILSFISLCIEPLARIGQLLIKRRPGEAREVIKGYYLLYQNLLRNV